MPSTKLEKGSKAGDRPAQASMISAQLDSVSTSERSSTARSLSFRQVEIFHTVTELRSITAASKLLKVSQPSISRTIQRLEDLLGFRLFERGKRGLIPTIRALRIYEESDAIIRKIRELHARINKIIVDRADVFRIGATSGVASALVPQVLSELLNQAQSLDLHFDVLSPNQADDYLLTGQVECLVSLEAARHPLIDSIAIGRGHLVAVVNCDHPLALRDVISAADLIGLDVVSFESGGQHGEAIEGYLQDTMGLCRVRAVVQYAETAMVLAGENVGVALVDSFTALSAPGKNVVVRQLADATTFHAYLHLNRERPRSQFVSLLIPLLRKRIAAL